MMSCHIQVQNILINDHDDMRTNLNKATALLPLIMNRSIDWEVDSLFTTYNVYWCKIQTARGDFAVVPVRACILRQVFYSKRDL